MLPDASSILATSTSSKRDGPRAGPFFFPLQSALLSSQFARSLHYARRHTNSFSKGEAEMKRRHVLSGAVTFALAFLLPNGLGAQPSTRKIVIGLLDAVSAWRGGTRFDISFANWATSRAAT